MLGERFSEISQQGDAPFVGGYAFYGDLVKSKDAFQMLVVPHEGREAEGLKALLLEAEKVKRFGFTNSELERAKTDLLKRIEKAYNDRENQRNNQLVREYVRHFLDNEVIPGIEWEYQTLQMLLPQLKADMINQMAKSYVTDENLVVHITSPEKETVKVPAEAEIIQLIADSKKAELTAKAEEDLSKPLIEKAPKAGKIKKASKNEQFGTTEWVLKNGVKVVFKPTKFKEDEILLSAFSQGGLSKVKDVADLPSAMMASGIVGNNGLGAFNQIDLNKALTGKIASVSAFIDLYSEGFDGNSSVKDFETMLQLIYLNFTAPRKDDNSFKALINMYNASLVNRASDPRSAFSDTVSTWVTNNHITTSPHHHITTSPHHHIITSKP
jgi:zinc protease